MIYILTTFGTFNLWKDEFSSSAWFTLCCSIYVAQSQFHGCILHTVQYVFYFFKQELRNILIGWWVKILTPAAMILNILSWVFLIFIGCAQVMGCSVAFICSPWVEWVWVAWLGGLAQEREAGSWMGLIRVEASTFPVLTHWPPKLDDWAVS